MKVRTVTVGVCLTRADMAFLEAGGSGDDSGAAALLGRAARFLAAARRALEAAGLEVQTARVALNSPQDFCDAGSFEQAARWLDARLAALGVGFAAAGPLRDAAYVRLVPAVLLGTRALSLSAELASPYDREGAAEAARVVRALAAGSDGGQANFRFGVTSQCAPGIPFFPAASHAGPSEGGERAPSTFAVGLECGDVLREAFEAAGGNLRRAEDELRARMTARLQVVERAALEAEHEHGVAAGEEPITYAGADASMNPSLAECDSIARAFELLGVGRFGSPGTLAVAALTTAALKSVGVRRCGFSGLMLPVCEDRGLAERAADGHVTVSELLLYSAVCGVGLDTVPVPGDATEAELAACFLDVTALATRLSKPLSARLFPIPGAAAGDMTEFDSPYLCNSAVMPLAKKRA